MGGARADIPREVGYDPGTQVTGARAHAAYTPWGLTTKPGGTQLSLIGILILVGIAYAFAHFERKFGK